MHQTLGRNHYTATLPHDTGFLEVQAPPETPGCRLYLRLTKGSSREYLSEYVAAQKRWNPHDWVPISLTLVVLAYFLYALSVAVFLLPFDEGFPALGRLLGIPYFVTAGLVMGACIVATGVSKERSGRRALALSVLSQKIGVGNPIDTGVDVSPSVAAQEVERVARGLQKVTPEMRDRLYGFLREGKTEVAGRAVRLLVDEAPREGGPSRREERAAIEADARRAIQQ